MSRCGGYPGRGAGGGCCGSVSVLGLPRFPLFSISGGIEHGFRASAPFGSSPPFPPLIPWDRGGGLGPGGVFPSLGVGQGEAVPPRSNNPWGRGGVVISAASPSPAKPFGGTGWVVCYCRVSRTWGCSGLPPGGAPQPAVPAEDPPGLLPEEENHKPSAGAGRAPPARRGAGSQAASCLLAGPCRWLAAAPADLPNTPPCPRRSPGTWRRVPPRPGAQMPPTRARHPRRCGPAFLQLSSGSQILRF